METSQELALEPGEDSAGGEEGTGIRDLFEDGLGRPGSGFDRRGGRERCQGRHMGFGFRTGLLVRRGLNQRADMFRLSTWRHSSCVIKEAVGYLSQEVWVRGIIVIYGLPEPWARRSVPREQFQSEGRRGLCRRRNSNRC